MPPAITKYIGDNPIPHISNATKMGIHILYLLILADFPVVSTGAMINATTAGRIPLKMRSTIGLSYDLAKNMAMSKIRMKEGNTVPNVAAILPRIPFSLFPVKIDILTAKIPGNDWDIAKASKNSSLFSHLWLVTTSFSIIEIIAHPPPKVNAPILKNV